MEGPRAGPGTANHRARREHLPSPRGGLLPPGRQPPRGSSSKSRPLTPGATSMHCIPFPATGKLDQREQGVAALPSWPWSPGLLADVRPRAACGPDGAAAEARWALSRLVSSATGASDLLHKREVTEVSLLTSLPGAGGELSGELISPENRRKHETRGPAGPPSVSLSSAGGVQEGTAARLSSDSGACEGGQLEPIVPAGAAAAEKPRWPRSHRPRAL